MISIKRGKERYTLGRTQPVLCGIRCSPRPVGDACLDEDVAHVAGHGVEADDQLLGYLLVGLAGGNQAQYL